MYCRDLHIYFNAPLNARFGVNADCSNLCGLKKKLLSLLQPQNHTTSGKHGTTLFSEPPRINCPGMKGSTEGERRD